MSLFDARKRDGNARIGNLKLSDEENISTPAVIETESVFPSLKERGFTNLPPSAGKADFERFFVPGSEPTAVHPQSESVEGSVLMYSN